jgi:hypothetical protein
MVMSFIPRCKVKSKWFDKDRSTLLEERQLRILTSVTEDMSQSQKFTFNQIGTLRFNGSSLTYKIEIGPHYDWDEVV